MSLDWKVMSIPVDGYKLGHRKQYPEGTTEVHSTWIGRSNKHLPQASNIVAYGFQGMVKEMHSAFQTGFFDRPKEEVIAEYKKYIRAYLGDENPEVEHLEALHDLGYLPLRIKSIKEGTLVPFRVPMLTVENTHPDFFWLTNYLETYMSAQLWKPCVVATIANVYRKMLVDYANRTSESPDFWRFQGHDFSARGHASYEDSGVSGSGHLVAGFWGTDSLSAIQYLAGLYGAQVGDEMIGVSIPATEHSVMSAGGEDNELETYRRLLTEVYPTGMVSVVSDTWNIWRVLGLSICQNLKMIIMSRDGKLGY